MGLWQTKKASAKEVKFSQLCPTLCNPMDYTVHGILQARILEWVAFPFARGSSQPRDWTQVSHIKGGFFTSRATREAVCTGKEITKWEGNLWNERNYLQIISDKGLIFKTYKKLIQPYSKTKHTHTYTFNPIKEWVKDLSRHFSKEDLQIVHRYMNRCSTSLISREMQTKAIVRYHLRPGQNGYYQQGKR